MKHFNRKTSMWECIFNDHFAKWGSEIRPGRFSKNTLEMLKPFTNFNSNWIHTNLFIWCVQSKWFHVKKWDHHHPNDFRRIRIECMLRKFINVLIHDQHYLCTNATLHNSTSGRICTNFPVKSAPIYFSDILIVSTMKLLAQGSAH